MINVDYVKFYLFPLVDLIVLYGDLIPLVIILLNRKYFQFNSYFLFFLGLDPSYLSK